MGRTLSGGPQGGVASPVSVTGSSGPPSPPELMAQDLSGLEVASDPSDGLEVARQSLVVVLAILGDGTNVPVEPVAVRSVRLRCGRELGVTPRTVTMPSPPSFASGCWRRPGWRVR